MTCRSKKKQKSKITRISTKEALSTSEVHSENILRLKITTRKGTRIESVPLKKLEKLATKNRKQWKIEGEWLILTAF